MSEPSASQAGPWRQRVDRLRIQSRRMLPFLSGMLAALAALFLYNIIIPPPPPLTTNDVNETIAQAMASATIPPAFSSYVYQAVLPSLVYIQVSVDGTPEGRIGSGVVVNDSGDILTSLHVVAGASEIQVIFADGTQSMARVAAAQPENDIAVLQASQLPAQIIPATLGNPNAMQVGDEAFAVGHPMGLYGSISAGVVSGLDRTFHPSGTQQEIEGLIQFDAAVNPGNSGGPLLNRAGQVIGIVTGLANPIGQNAFAGIGFAVPITVAGGAAGMPPY